MTRQLRAIKSDGKEKGNETERNLPSRGLLLPDLAANPSHPSSYRMDKGRERVVVAMAGVYRNVTSHTPHVPSREIDLKLCCDMSRRRSDTSFFPASGWLLESRQPVNFCYPALFLCERQNLGNFGELRALSRLVSRVLLMISWSPEDQGPRLVLFSRPTAFVLYDTHIRV